MNKLVLDTFTLSYSQYSVEIPSPPRESSHTTQSHTGWQLGPLSFTIQEGEYVGLIGGSGSGKSSLLHAIQHYEQYPQEHISYSGTLSKPSVRLMSILQEPKATFNPMHTVYSMFRSLSRTKYGIPKISKTRMYEYLAAVGLYDAHVLHARSKNLSGGMAQRVMLALLLALDTQWLLADEPSSSLDEYHEEKILDLIQSCMSTCIFVSHKLSLVVKYCNRVIFLDNGIVIYDGDINTFLSSSHPTIRLYRENSMLSYMKGNV